MSGLEYPISVMGLYTRRVLLSRPDRNGGAGALLNLAVNSGFPMKACAFHRRMASLNLMAQNRGLLQLLPAAAALESSPAASGKPGLRARGRGGGTQTDLPMRRY